MGVSAYRPVAADVAVAFQQLFCIDTAYVTPTQFKDQLYAILAIWQTMQPNPYMWKWRQTRTDPIASLIARAIHLSLHARITTRIQVDYTYKPHRLSIQHQKEGLQIYSIVTARDKHLVLYCRRLVPGEADNASGLSSSRPANYCADGATYQLLVGAHLSYTIVIADR